MLQLWQQKAWCGPIAVGWEVRTPQLQRMMAGSRVYHASANRAGLIVNGLAQLVGPRSPGLRRAKAAAAALAALPDSVRAVCLDARLLRDGWALSPQDVAGRLLCVVAVDALVNALPWPCDHVASDDVAGGVVLAQALGPVETICVWTGNDQPLTGPWAVRDSALRQAFQKNVSQVVVHQAVIPEDLSDCETPSADAHIFWGDRLVDHNLIAWAQRMGVMDRSWFYSSQDVQAPGALFKNRGRRRAKWQGVY